MSFTFSIEDREEEYSKYSFQLNSNEDAKKHARIWVENKNEDKNNLKLINCVTGENIPF
jgi:hypothetical protein